MCPTVFFFLCSVQKVRQLEVVTKAVRRENRSLVEQNRVLDELNMRLLEERQVLLANGDRSI